MSRWMGSLLCRFGLHAWSVRGTLFDWESPFHIRTCMWCKRRQIRDSWSNVTVRELKPENVYELQKRRHRLHRRHLPHELHVVQ